MELNIAILIVMNYRDISQYRYYRSALAEGFANQSPARFLLDSRAAVSIVRLAFLSDNDQRAITRTNLSAVSANDTSIDVKGEIKLVVSIGSFTCEHTLL